MDASDPNAPLVTPRSGPSWPAASAALVARFEAIAGPFRQPTIPMGIALKSPALAGMVLEGETTHDDNVVSCTIRYGVDRDAEVPAILLWRADLDHFRPAIALHQTTAPISLGKEEAAGFGGRADLDYGRLLAREGFAVICPDYPLFGTYADAPATRGEGPDKSVTMKALINHHRALDVLALWFGHPLPEGAVAAVGHSLGGSNTIFLSAFDRRIGAAASSCGFCDFQGYADISPHGDLTGWARPDKYMPLIDSRYGRDYRRMPIDFGALIGAIAPRPFFASIPPDDDVFDFAGAMRAIGVAKSHYTELGARQALHWVTPKVGHTFPESARAGMVALFKQAIVPRPRRAS